MPSDPAATLTSLLRQSTIDDHEEVLRAANASLKISKTDLAAQRTRVVALLKLDRFEDALRAITDGGSQLQVACSLEHAYTLYKLGQLDEAAKTIGSATDRSASHLAAQVAYRAERFKDAVQIYDALSSSSAAGDEESDLEINSLATVAQRDWQATGNTSSSISTSVPSTRASSTESPATFEVAYNIACGAIAQGEFSRALTLLQKAGRLCGQADELSDDEKQLEMVPILVQQAFVYSRLGQDSEAVKLHKQLGSDDLDDVDIKAILGNNVSALENGGDNAFVTQRQIASAATVANTTKLFKFQEASLTRNRLALALRAQKFPGVVRETQRLLASPSDISPAEAFELSVINVAARSLIHSSSVSLREVQPIIAERPADVGTVLTAVQLYVLANNLDAALALLEALLTQLEETGSLTTRFLPGLVALAVSLYRLQGRHGCIRNELAKAATYWTKQDKRHSSSLLKGAGAELLKSSDSGDLAAAGAAFEKLCAQPTQDPIARAGLVASFAKNEPSKVQPYLDTLPAVSVLISGTDTRSLLDQGVVSAQLVASLGKKRAAADTMAAGQTKNKRRRKLPKNYEEGKKVDPERWLPLRDRSSYRPKGRKGKKKIADNTQGGFVRDEEMLELAGGAGSVKVEKAPTQPSSSNKKKKKGKK